MNLVTIATWISILSFILAIPMAIAANMFTPRLSEWWNHRPERSKRSRVLSYEKRITYLQRFDQNQFYTLGEILKRFVYLIICSTQLCVVAVRMFLGSLRGELFRPPTLKIIFQASVVRDFSIFLFVVTIIFFLLVCWKIIGLTYYLDQSHVTNELVKATSQLQELKFSSKPERSVTA